MSSIMPERSSIVKEYFQYPLPLNKRKRYASGAMTVCSSVITHDSCGDPTVLMVADMRLSWDYDSIDTAYKVHRVHPKWLFGFATNSTQSSACLIPDMCEALKGRKTLREIQAASQGVWRGYTGWQFLFAGFDGSDSSHIFTIDEAGVCDRDLLGFGSVGTGAFLADAFLCSYPYGVGLPIAEAIYCVLAAKFTAERAGGVGQKTYLARLHPQDGIINSIPDDATPTIEGGLIDSVRAKWETLSRTPEGTLEEIEKYLNRFSL